MKNICGFINKGQGGRLYIGINDDDEILGLELDFKRLRKRYKNSSKGDKDLLNAEISQDIKKYFSKNADYVFSQLSMEPIYIKKNFARNDTGKDLEILKITIYPKPKVTKLIYVKDPNRNNESFYYMKTNHGSKSMHITSVSDWYVNNNAN